MDSFLLKIASTIVLAAIFSGMVIIKSLHGQMLNINEHGYFEHPGVNFLLFSNPPGGMFSDAKTSGLEIIHHGERTVTNGDVRLHNTPEQWDDLAEFIDREIDEENNKIKARLRYSDYGFTYTVKATAHDGGIILSVHLDSPLPEALEGRAGFNLEFLPAAYFGKAYLIDGISGIFPRHPTGLMEMRDNGKTEPRPIATGQKLVLAPEDPERRITITTSTPTSTSTSTPTSTSTVTSTAPTTTSADNSGRLMLFDGRNKAQNGWFVVRTLIPAGRTGNVIEWFIEANVIPEWTRKPVITYSQAGYHPEQQKRAVIELDQNDTPLYGARLLKVSESGEMTESYAADVTNWGRYLRYHYVIFDFS
jgi:endoglucanase